MKNNFLILSSFAVLFTAVALLIRFNPEPITDEQLANISKAVETVFQPRTQMPAGQPKSNPESIMAVIYRREAATWFIKGRGTTLLVNQQAEIFNCQ